MFLNSLNIAGSGLTAQRLRIDVVSQNLANVDTTNAPGEDPYRRKTVTLGERTQATFTGYLDKYIGQPGGVSVTSIGEDPTDFKLEYDPTNASADADGYVRLPNVDTVTEMTDLLESSKAYTANVTAFNTLKNISNGALNIGR